VSGHDTAARTGLCGLSRLAVCGGQVYHAPDRGAWREPHCSCRGAHILLRCADSAWRTMGGEQNDTGRSATTMGSVSWHALGKGVYAGSGRWLAGAGTALLGLDRGWQRAEARHGPLDLAGHGVGASALPTLVAMGAIL